MQLVTLCGPFCGPVLKGRAALTGGSAGSFQKPTRALVRPACPLGRVSAAGGGPRGDPWPRGDRLCRAEGTCGHART